MDFSLALAALKAGARISRTGWNAAEQFVVLQLSHNAITGQDDPAMLRELFEELEGIAEREYSGLDDKTLELLESVSVESLNEADLDYASVQILFLPGEKDAAQEAFEHAAALGKADARWVAGIGQYEAALDALDTAKSAHNVGNIATALGLVLAVFEAHLGDLRDGWYDPGAGEARHKGRIPIESLLATRTMPAASAAVVAQALDKATKTGDLDGSELWRVLEMWATDYLAP